MIRLESRRLRAAAFVGLCVAVGTTLGMGAARARTVAPITPDTTRLGQSVGTYHEQIAVLIGSQNCGASRTPGFPQAIERMKQDLASRATQQGMKFSTVGVAIDWSIPEGLAFLDAFGEFDEIRVGRNWLNSGAVDYMWLDRRVPAMVPQVVIVERRVDVTGGSIVVGDSKIIARVDGTTSIMEWVQRGSALP